METQKLIELFDAYLISKGKKQLSLRTANEILKTTLDIEKSINLKEILESNKIPHAYLTENKPRQWYIPFSNMAIYSKKRKEYLETLKKFQGNSVEVPKKNRALFIFLIVGVIWVLFKVGSNSETEKSNINETKARIDLGTLSGENLTLKSTYNIKQIGSQIVQENYEDTYYTLDFTNMTLTSKLPINNEWLTLTYPIKRLYSEKSTSGSIYVLVVDDFGLKDVKFNPYIPSLSFTYLDGSKIACSQLSIVE